MPKQPVAFITEDGAVISRPRPQGGGHRNAYPGGTMLEVTIGTDTTSIHLPEHVPLTNWAAVQRAIQQRMCGLALCADGNAWRTFLEGKL